MIHLAQQALLIINGKQTNDECPVKENLIKVQNVFDKIHKIFIQYVDSVYILSKGKDNFRNIIPNLQYASQIFSKQYRIPFTYSYHILRKSSKPVYDMTKDEFF
jgi:hypothetical protein